MRQFISHVGPDAVVEHAIFVQGKPRFTGVSGMRDTRVIYENHVNVSIRSAREGGDL